MTHFIPGFFPLEEDFFPTTANRSLNNAFYPMLETVFMAMCTAHSRAVSRPLGTPDFLGLGMTLSALFSYT